jgi:hypothetical protein
MDQPTTIKLIDIALGALAFEAVLLVLLRQVTRRSLPLVDILAQLAAGACLILALRFSTHRELEPRGLFFLTAALPAHLFDLARRVYWHRTREPR